MRTPALTEARSFRLDQLIGADHALTGSERGQLKRLLRISRNDTARRGRNTGAGPLVTKVLAIDAPTASQHGNGAAPCTRPKEASRA